MIGYLTPKLLSTILGAEVEKLDYIYPHCFNFKFASNSNLYQSTDFESFFKAYEWLQKRRALTVAFLYGTPNTEELLEKVFNLVQMELNSAAAKESSKLIVKALSEQYEKNKTPLNPLKFKV